MKERRRHRRIKKYFGINIVALETGGKAMRFDAIRNSPKFCDESGLDFSPAGLKVMCSKPLPPEAKIQMKIIIPEHENLNLIRANGSVKYFKQVKGTHKKYFIIGVLFNDLSPDDKAKLLRLWRTYKQ